MKLIKWGKMESLKCEFGVPTAKHSRVEVGATKRTCWWNEVCKEEFQQMFRCRCPQWSYCRSPGRYYNAYCSMTNTGYIWTQPTWDWETA
ncbi:hypothetical protein AND_008652 [Anopheles darlingi]|uniref:Uncharacterized protein n=1 Tax=Anopheles darlingi TaxID=43151 RepID=W5J8N9_ANODA|nr:hypothetical protein AND_008652 [Anopheles darlingi]